MIPASPLSPRLARLLLSTLLSWPLAGCGLAPLALEGDCADERRDGGGRCCPVWFEPDGLGCAGRAWSLPGPDSGLGEAGARWLNVTVDGLGRPAATWIEQGEQGGRVVVAESLEGGYSLRSPSGLVEGDAIHSDIAGGPDGALLAVWKQQYPGDEARLFMSEREASGPWRDPASKEDSFSFLPTAYEPRPRFFPDGERLVVWNQWMSTGYGVAVGQKRPGGDWQFPSGADDVLSQHFYFSNAPTPAVNARGDAIISWYQSDSGALLSWQSERFGHEGAFSRPGPEDYLSDRGGSIDSHGIANPRPALSPSGEGVVAWTQENGKGSVLVYLATRTADGVWTKPDGLDDALSPRLGYARCAQPVFAPTGDLFVVWYQDTGGGNRVLAAHRDPAGQWVEPGREPTVLSTPGVEAGFPVIAAGEGGAVLSAWSERRGDTWVVAARRRGPSGTGWGPIEVLSEPTAGAAVQAAAAIGGPGDVAIVGWVQGTGGGERAFLATVP